MSDRKREVAGASGDGRAGETVSVRLKGAARLTGRIVEGGRVEVTL